MKKVFDAIHEADPDPKCSPTSTCRHCRKDAAGDANKVWVVPAELTQAPGSFGLHTASAGRQVEGWRPPEGLRPGRADTTPVRAP